MGANERREMRGAEALTDLEAINTGHGGSVSTIHTERRHGHKPPFSAGTVAGSSGLGMLIPPGLLLSPSCWAGSIPAFSHRARRAASAPLPLWPWRFSGAASICAAAGPYSATGSISVGSLALPMAAGFCILTQSEAALKTFREWFLKVSLDQITFSAKLFDLGGLEKRSRRLVEDPIDDKRAPDLMSAVLRHGALERGDAQIVLKTSERTALRRSPKRVI